MVYCDSHAVFLKSIDTSNVIIYYKCIYKQIDEVIKQVGKENVAQIVTDNDSNYKKIGKRIMSKYRIYWTPYATYCIHLMLKDFGKKKLVKKIVRDARIITNFIYNHSYILAFMRSPKCCGSDLNHPGVT